MENPPFEDVYPIKNGGFSIAMLVYPKVDGGFKHLLLLSLTWGRWNHFDKYNFSGWVGFETTNYR